MQVDDLEEISKIKLISWRGAKHSKPWPVILSSTGHDNYVRVQEM